MDRQTKTVLVTGHAGFIGNALALKLLQSGYRVVGVDNINAYYDRKLKYARLERLKGIGDFFSCHLHLEHGELLEKTFKKFQPSTVIHLAAQAGVRYSLTNPKAYTSSNIDGFINVLEAVRTFGCDHLIYASSSSVYGASAQIPFSTQDRVDEPLSLYAATKKANELMAHTYSHLYDIPTTGLRFFTVYGPWMRPDMVPFVFAELALKDKPIKVFNHGKMSRDFTYIDDIVDGIISLVGHAPPQRGEGPFHNADGAPYRVFNIGNRQPVDLMELIDLLEKALDRPIIKEFVPMQPGDVPRTFANIDDLTALTGFIPKTSLRAGVSAFASWYKEVWPSIATS